jgi:hypothetical protein
MGQAAVALLRRPRNARRLMVHRKVLDGTSYRIVTVTRLADVRKGSKAEKLNASICFPLCTLKADIDRLSFGVRF